jgi:DNA/RNA endonuclease YhcR with UshA esterase domain
MRFSSALLLTLGLMAGGALVPSALAEPAAPAAATDFAPLPGAVPVAGITRDQLNTEITIVGTITAAMAPTSETAPTRLTLDGPAGDPITIVYWKEGAPLEAGRGIPPVGTRVSVRGILQEFKPRNATGPGMLQIRVTDPAQVAIAGYSGRASAGTALAAKATVQPGPDGYFTANQLPELLSTRLNEVIRFKGTLVEYKAPTSERAPHVLVVGENPNTIEIVYWNPREGGQAPVFSTVGATIHAEGTLQDYRGRKQIAVRDLRLIGTAPIAGTAPQAAAAASAPGAATGDLVPGPDGYFVPAQLPALLPNRLNQDINFKAPIIRYQAPANDRAPHVLIVGEGQNTIEIAYWNARFGGQAPVYNQIGQTIHVAGTLQEFRGRRQIAVRDLDALSLTPLPAEKMAGAPRGRSTETQPASKGWPGAQPVTDRPLLQLAPGTFVPLNQIAPEHHGNTITTTGKLSRLYDRGGTTMALLSQGLVSVQLRLTPGAPAASLLGRDVTVRARAEYNATTTQVELVLADDAALAEAIPAAP